MSLEKNICVSIIKFLQDEMKSTKLSEGSKESLEVAIQCLESAYNVTEADKDAAVNGPSLNQMFCSPDVEVTEEIRNKAEQLKSEGNTLMKSANFDEAVSRYSEAIKLDPGNAVYYCNRAAALSKMDRHHSAVEDCLKAISIDPDYSKAYGRMGLAYASLNEHKKAHDCYQKAVEIDPNNESYVTNLKIAEEKVNECNVNNGLGACGSAATQGGLGFDISQVLSNPALMNTAMNMISNPGMQDLMSSFLSNSGGADGSGMDALLQFGRQFADQMQTSNPQLVQELRDRMQNVNNDKSNEKPEDPNKQPE